MVFGQCGSDPKVEGAKGHAAWEQRRRREAEEAERQREAEEAERQRAASVPPPTPPPKETLTHKGSIKENLVMSGPLV